MTGQWGSTVALALLVAAGTMSVGSVGAAHGPDAAEFTVEPIDDRTPGATNVEYGMRVVGGAGIDFETLRRTRAVFEAGSWASCSPGDAGEFGIDRGSTHEGYRTDEGLQENVKTFSAGEDVFETEYNGEEDFGPSTHLDDGDELVSVAKCPDNPDKPGWYQMTGSSTGITESGERVTYGGDSHYFWICECENDAEAREELGRPPSDSTPTATPTAAEDTETDSDDGADSTGGADDSTAESGPGSETPPDTATPEAAEASGQSPALTATATATATPTVDREWDDVVGRSPTPGGGDGFGVVVSVLALAATVVFLYRRGSRETAADSKD